MIVDAAPASALDPFSAVPEIAGVKGYYHSAGRSIVHPAVIGGENTGVFICAGQSNIANNVNSNYTPSSSKAQMLSIYDGGVYSATDPALGCSGASGSIIGRIADSLISNAVYDRAIMVPVAVGGTSVAQWVSTLHPRLLIAAKRLRAVGLSETAILWMQGETDNQLGTSQSTYAASLASLIALYRAEGYIAPWLIGKCTYYNGATSSGVRAAQAGVVNGTDIFAGADTDSLTSGNRQGDNTHLNATGAASAATLWKTAIDAVF